MTRRIIITIMMIVCAVCVGCETHSESKKLAQQRFEKSSARIKLGLAQQEYDQKNLDKAYKTVSECIAADPCMPEAHLLLGRLLFLRGLDAKAETELNLAVEQDQDLAEGWYWLGLAAQHKRSYEQAEEYYNRALSIEPLKVGYIMAVADVYCERDQHEQAASLLKEKMQLLPGEVALNVAAADMMVRTGENERAIALYKEATFMRPDDETIAESLGHCYISCGKWTEGSEVFAKLYEQCTEPNKRRSYLELVALCSMNSAQYSRAVHYYDKLSVEDTDNAEIWLIMGQAALGAGAAHRAYDCAEKVLSLQPGSADAIALIGCAQYMRGDYEAAVSSFKRIGSDKNNGGFSWLMRSRSYEKLGQISLAERAYNKALELNPRSKLGDLMAKGKERRKTKSVDTLLLWE